MTFLQQIILAVLQGITEFLPISSSGHLVLFQKLFRMTAPPIFFDIMLHFGTLSAILLFFRKEIIFLFKDWKNKIHLWLLLFIGSIPAAVFGLFLSSRLETVFNSLKIVSVCWIINGILLLLTAKFKNIKVEKLSQTRKLDALTVGFFQAVALLPGISRSGSTIFAGLWRKMTPEIAFSFSFLLSIPAVLGATFLQVKNISYVVSFGSIFSMFLAGVIGFFSLKILKKILISDRLFYFGYYCLGLGLLVLLLS